MRQRAWNLVLILLVILSRGLKAEPVEVDGLLVHPTRVLALPRSAEGKERGAVRILDEARLESASGEDAKAAAVRQAERLRSRLEALRASGRYAWVEPDHVLQVQRLPSDAHLLSGALWGIYNTGGEGRVTGVDIGATGAWDATTGSDSVIVAVIDTGIRTTHREFIGNLWINPGESGAGQRSNGRDDDGDGFRDNVHGVDLLRGSGSGEDRDGHGTHIAATIGAAANDGNPLVGVAWDVSLMSVRAFDDRGYGYTSDVVRGIDFAVARGARIINASFGGDGYSQALHDAIARAGEAGVLVVAAAGNESRDLDLRAVYPAGFDLPNILSVAALNAQGYLAGFSNYGRRLVDIAAPGEGILSANRTDDRAETTLSGTSMAAPHVTGVAALVLAQVPEITPADLRSWLMYTATQSGTLSGFVEARGWVNAHRATHPASVAPHLSLRPVGMEPFAGGSEVVFEARILRPLPLAASTLVASIPGEPEVALRDDGIAPDRSANDRVYTAKLLMPAGPPETVITISGQTSTGVNVSAQRRVRLAVPSTNDAFTTARPLEHTTSGTTVGATREAGEPVHGGVSGGASLWWTWTAPGDGLAVVRTDGSAFDTVLAVYTGNTLATLQPFAADNDSGVESSSMIQMRVTSGTRYRIALDGVNGAQGDYALTIGFTLGVAPANDRFENRERLVTDGFGWVKLWWLNNGGASLEPGEQELLGQAINGSVWYTYTPETDGTVTITNIMPGANAAVRGVFRGNTLAELVRVPADLSKENVLVLQVSAGVPLQLLVASSQALWGNYNFTLTIEAPPVPPANDAFAAAESIPFAGGVIAGSTRHSTREAGEPVHNPGNPSGGSVWYRWTAPSSGTVRFSFGSPSVSSTLVLYTGITLDSLAVDREDIESWRFEVIGGVTYHIAVQTVDLNTWFRFALSFAPSGGTALNDSIADACPVMIGPWDAYEMRVVGRTHGATLEPGEPTPRLSGTTGTVWYRVTSSFPRFLSVVSFSAAALPTLYSGDGYGSLVRWNGFAGVIRPGMTVWVAVESTAGVDFEMKMLFEEIQEQASDAFADRPLLPAAGARFNLDAISREPGEPFHAGMVGLGSRWLRLVGNGDVLRLEGDSFSSNYSLAVYTGSTLDALVPVASTVVRTNSQWLSFHAAEGVEYQIAVSPLRPAGRQMLLKAERDRSYASFLPYRPGGRFHWRIDFDYSGVAWLASSDGGATFSPVVVGPMWSAVTGGSLTSGNLPASADGTVLRRRLGTLDSGRWLENTELVALPRSDSVSVAVSVAEIVRLTASGVIEARVSAQATGRAIQHLSWQVRSSGSSEWRDALELAEVGLVPSVSGTYRFDPIVASSVELRALAVACGLPPVASNVVRLADPSAPVAPAFRTAPPARVTNTGRVARIDLDVVGQPRPVVSWEVRSHPEAAWESLASQVAHVRGETFLELRSLRTTDDGMQFRATLSAVGHPSAVSEPITLGIVRTPALLRWRQAPVVTYGRALQQILAEFLETDLPAESRRVVVEPASSGLLIPAGTYAVRATLSDPTHPFEAEEAVTTLTVRRAAVSLVLPSLVVEQGSEPASTSWSLLGWDAATTALAQSQALATLRHSVGPSSVPGLYSATVDDSGNSNFDVLSGGGQIAVIRRRADVLGARLEGPLERISGVANSTRGIYFPQPGPFGVSTATYFDGTSGAVYTNHQDRQATVTPAVALWMAPVSQGNPDARGRTPLFWKSGTGGLFELSWKPDGGVVEVSVLTSSGLHTVVSTRPAPQGRWTHVIAEVTPEAGVTLALRINGQRAGSKTGIGEVVANANRIRIGNSHPVAPLAGFFGYIDTVDFYRVPMLPIEVDVAAGIGPFSKNAHLLRGATEYAGNWRTVPGLGRLYSGNEFPWVYHTQLGWIYLGPTPDGYWIHDPGAAAAGLFTWAYAREGWFPRLALPGAPTRWIFASPASTPSRRLYYRYDSPPGWHTITGP